MSPFRTLFRFFMCLLFLTPLYSLFAGILPHDPARLVRRVRGRPRQQRAREPIGDLGARQPPTLPGEQDGRIDRLINFQFKKIPGRGKLFHA